jgi:glutathione synthase/RimK-type ligase-like ATP-grasp enzyme
VVVALITAGEARDHDKDLQPIYDALVARGVAVEIHNWDDAAVDWKQFAAAIVRSPWDYHRRFDEFSVWLRHVSTCTTLHNPAEVISWNLDKTYLAECEHAGIAVIPTLFVSSAENISDNVHQLLQQDVVVKPSISAGSNNTERFRNDYAAASTFVHHILEMGKTAMVQPYQHSIDDDDETALNYFNGEFSHAFRKGAILSTGINVKNGLFVVEDISPREPTDAQRALGAGVMSFLINRWGEAPLYARVDMVPSDTGDPVVIEIEMAEPSFFFHTAFGSAERFADAVLMRIGQ